MALRLPDFDERIEFVLEEDRTSEVPTVFLLRRLTGAELTRVAALSPMPPVAAMQVHAIRATAEQEKRELTAEETERINAIAPMGAAFFERRMEQLRLACSLGVAGHRHLLDAAGRPSSMSGADIAQKCPSSWVAQIGEEVMRLSSLLPGEQKNLSAPPALGD